MDRDQSSSLSSEGDSHPAVTARVRAGGGVEALEDYHYMDAPDRDRRAAVGGPQAFTRGRSVSSSSSPCPSSLTGCATVDSGHCSSGATSASGSISVSVSAPSSPTKEMSPVPAPISLRECTPPPAPARFCERTPNSAVHPSPTIQLVARRNIQQFNTAELDHHDGKWARPRTPNPKFPKWEPATDTKNGPSINHSVKSKNSSLSSGVAFFELVDGNGSQLSHTHTHGNEDEVPLNEKKQSDEMRDRDLKFALGEPVTTTLMSGEKGSINMESASPEESTEVSPSDSTAPAVDKKVYPMAFTVDFGDGEDTKKSLEITDSISKFAPRHRKNLSLSLSKGEDFDGKKEGSPPSSEKTSSSGASTTRQHHKKGSLGNELNEQRESSTIATKKTAAAFCNLNSNGNGNSNASKPPTGSTSTPKPSQAHRIGNGSRKTDKLAHFQRNKPNAMDLKDMSNNNHLRPSSSSKEGKGLLNSRQSLHDDNASETGTYTVDKESAEVKSARKNIDRAVAESLQEDADACQESVGATGLGWVREWAESAAQQRVSPVVSPELETQGFLHDTENLVSAMQRRVNGKQMPSSGTAGPSTIHHQQNGRSRLNPNITAAGAGTSRASPICREGSVLSDSGYALGYASDSSNDGGGNRESKNGVKYNRAFAIRRGRVVGYDSDNCVTRQSVSATVPFRGASPRPQQHGTNSANANVHSFKPSSTPPPAFSRTDGGRFSLRAPKAKPNLPYQQSTFMPQRAKGSPGFPDAAMRKGLSLTPNPTRRDMIGGRSNSTLTSKEVELANWKRRKNYDPMKAAQAGYGKKRETADKFCESGSDNPGEEMGSSRVARIPLYKSALVNSSPFASTSHAHAAQASQEYYVSGNSEDEDSNEIPSSHSSSPTNMLMSRSLHGETHSQHSIARPKNKLEALDSLVISTIHSLSIKVRTCSRQLLEKLQVHYSADENGALLEEMVTQLKDLENATSPTKTTSRELSGTLKNLKKIEQVILVLDRVLCEDESDPA